MRQDAGPQSEPHRYPRYFHIAGYSVNSYKVLLCVGIYVGTLVSAAVAYQSGISPLRMGIGSVACGIIGMCGARLLYLISHARSFAHGRFWSEVWNAKRGGWSVFGGLLIVPFSWVLADALGIPVGIYWDHLICGIVAGAVFVRFGCICNGCCVGRATTKWYGVRQHDTHYQCQRRIPVQWLEIAWWLLAGAGLIVFWPYRFTPGSYASAGLCWYGVGRFWLEPLREHQDMIGRFRLNQLIAALLALSAFGVFISLVFVAFPAGLQIGYSSENPPRLNPRQIEETVSVVAKTIEAEYFDADVAKRVSDSLLQWHMQQRYAVAETEEALASQLTKDLFELTQDKHLAVNALDAIEQTQQASDESRRQVNGKRINFGVQSVEVLSGNVGYLHITAFYRIEEVRDVFAAAMQIVRNADALILDLRENGGGSPESVALMASYFFAEEELPLFEIVSRAGESRVYRTQSNGISERNERRPIFVLTSSRTFSAGEGMAFLLQERGRAEVIGEKTAGAANPGRPYPVGNRFEVTVPNGKVRTAISGKNWEGSGVTPDVMVSAADARRIAHLRALEQLVAQSEPGDWRNQLEAQIKELSQSTTRSGK